MCSLNIVRKAGILFLLYLATNTVACAATYDVNCGSTSLQATVDTANDGDTINVKGVCYENIFIHTDTDKLTLQGVAGAVIKAADPARSTLHIRGRLIVVKDITVTGGHNGINVERGGSMVVNRVKVSGNSNIGIAVTKNAYASILNSKISNNSRHGILVGKTAHARIGFPNDQVVTSQPNSIISNGGHGIAINRTAVAEMVGNTISANGKSGIYVAEGASARIGEVGVASWSGPNFIRENNGHGVLVTDVSFAEIKNNMIDGNSRHGVYVKWNSGVRIDNNSTTSPNADFGVRCEKGGSVEGSIGTLNGGAGPSLYSSNCIF